MKEVLGCIRRCDKDFGLIQAGDTVCVGVSGGKDSMLLLYAMALYRKFCPNKYNLIAATLHMGLEPFDLEPVKALCEKLEVPYTVEKTQIAQVIFEERKEKNPCSLCARMRRGLLHDTAKEYGMGFGASVLNPLDIGGGWAKVSDETGFSYQYLETEIRPDGSYA
ncbi:MAG: hypothetical protein IJB99_05810, partial [Clostridia bacterium]|nr:hypothetical protein [Clostridia bacterium]